MHYRYRRDEFVKQKLPEIALSGASKLASTYVFIIY